MILRSLVAPVATVISPFSHSHTHTLTLALSLFHLSRFNLHQLRTHLVAFNSKFSPPES